MAKITARGATEVARVELIREVSEIDGDFEYRTQRLLRSDGMVLQRTGYREITESPDAWRMTGWTIRGRAKDTATWKANYIRKGWEAK